MSAQNTLPRVVLVDDHPAMLRQTIQLLSPQFEIVHALPDGRQLLPLVAKGNLDLIVLDITLPEPSGIDLAVQLRRVGCSAKIVFLTVHADRDYAREAFEAGACGYVLKPRLASDLIPALKGALSGKIFISAAPELKELAL